MQVSYRETKAGFECIHMPSIELSSVHDDKLSTARRQDNHHSHFDPHGTVRRAITKKPSKLSFGRKRKEEKSLQSDSTTEKDQPGQHPTGPNMTATASSGSSSFFNVSSNTHTIRPEIAQGNEEKSNLPVINGDENTRSQSPTKPKTLPPIPRDFAVQSPPSPQLNNHLPIGEIDNSLFERVGSNSLCVRFEINVIKVCPIDFAFE